MIKFIRNIFTSTTKIKETPMTARITETFGTFSLVNKNGKTIATYSRARDARRGALRRGLTLVA